MTRTRNRRGIRRGQRRGFTRFFERHYDDVHRYAVRRLGADSADDVAAETFGVAWRRYDRLPKDQPLPWLYGVARNVIRARRRHDRRRGEVLAPEGGARGPREPDTVHQVEERDTALRALAEHEDVLYAGTARDREGREGELFLVEEDAGDGYVLERRIMFAPDTGMPLYHETVAVESDSVPDEDLPQVNQYTVLVESAWVPEVGETP